VGVEAHRGGLSDLDSLAAGALACEGVIHTAFIHDWSTTTREAAAETDRRAVEALAGALEGSGKPLVVTSGTALLEHGRMGTEEDAPASAAAARARLALIDIGYWLQRGYMEKLDPNVYRRSPKPPCPPPSP
jgi:hypothetical protein